MACTPFVGCQALAALSSVTQTTVHPGTVLRAALLTSRAAIPDGCAKLPPSTPELAPLDPQPVSKVTGSPKRSTAPTRRAAD
jgi:hypothetical protein